MGWLVASLVLLLVLGALVRGSRVEPISPEESRALAEAKVALLRIARRIDVAQHANEVRRETERQKKELAEELREAGHL